ncbi:MAG TPA: metallophosphoesterase [Bacteroidia bacterium]|nr:metallophosphoesterase [Bacteroidia bacterium]
MSFRLLIILAILFIIDLYAFQSVKFLCKGLPASQIRNTYFIYWSVSVFCFGLIIIGNIFDWHQWNKAFRTYSFAFVFILFFSKLFVDIFLLMDDLIRIFRWSGTKIISAFGTPDSTKAEVVTKGISRSDFLVKLAVIIGAIPFFSMIYGMLNGAYNYRKRKVILTLNNLPKSFDGFKIVQISDIHTGSFTRMEPVKDAIKIINDQQPDLVFFTGDLVNDRHEEALPFLDILKAIKAKHGVYSIFGNHDYGDYMKWDNDEAKKDNLRKLADVHRQLGWNLLLDEHRHIEKNGERITVIGVQNWSARMGFQKYGSIEKATENINYSPVNILLSHDPSHWKAQITDKYDKIDLTLSGHTHGMQFGVEIPGFKWSPVQYFYKEWADLYKHKNQFLYVNRGLGFLAYPGRVGILPEITVFELRRA